MAGQIRETKIITTPGAHTVELYTYLTGRESVQIKEIMYTDMKMTASDIANGKVTLGEMSPAFMIKQEQKALELLLVSVDSETENAFEKLGNLPEADYNVVFAEMEKIRVPFKKEKSN